MPRALIAALLLSTATLPVPSAATPDYSRMDALGAHCPPDEPGPLTCYFESKGDCMRALQGYYERREPYYLQLLSRCERSRDPALGTYELRMIVW